jgi:hypothetical protein
MSGSTNHFFFSQKLNAHFPAQIIASPTTLDTCETVEVYTGFWWENLREGDYLEHSGVDGRIILMWIFEKWVRGHGIN